MSRHASSSNHPDRLRVTSGPRAGSVIELDFDGRVTIGRSSACEILLKDLSISRRHAELHKTPSGRWRIRDLDSRNGIAVDGRTGPGWLVIDPGSEIAIGDVELVFEKGLDPFVDHTDPATDPGAAPGPAPRRRPSRPPPPDYEDPPSMPDPEPRPRKPAPPPWRGGVRATGAAGRSEASRPPYLLGAAIGLGAALAVAAAVVMLGRMTEKAPDEEMVDPLTEETGRAAINALVANAREAAAEERWDDVEALSKRVLERRPEHSEAKSLLELTARERRAFAEVSAAESAFDAGDFDEAELIAEGVHAQSRYRHRADDILDLIERGETRRPGRDAPEREPEREEPAVAQADPEPEPEVRKTRPSPRPPRKQAPRRSPRRSPPAKKASARTDPILSDAKAAFAQGRVSDARAAAEAASDAGVAGADNLARQLDSFHHASRTGDAARGRGELPLALAHFTDALAVARQISPPAGGSPGTEISGRLADLHYESARQSLERDDSGAARAHLERALSFQPRHSRARALLDAL